ncbi:MAG TPA: S-layer homology domain-containing protein [Firmicutes bacterium]|nr:S-layer homology domain-containing protein [Bacillota bacterium]
MKRYYARILTAALIAATSLSVCVPVMASDTPSSWAANQIQEAISYGLIPDQLQEDYQSPITRLEFVEYMMSLWRDYHGIEDNVGLFLYGAGIGETPFTDTDSEAAHEAVDLGIMNGTSSTTFSPNDTLTREMAAAVIVNFAKSVDKPIPAGSVSFTDEANISDWAKESVGQVAAVGIIQGMGDGSFQPKTQLTKEQALILGFQAFKYVRGQLQAPSGTNTQAQTGQEQNSQTNQGQSGDVSQMDYAFRAVYYLYNHLKFPSTMDILSIRTGIYNRSDFYDGAPEFVIPTNNMLSNNHDYYLVNITYQAANSLGDLVTDSCVCLYDYETGETLYEDMVGYASSMADGAWGASKSRWMDLESEALLLAAAQGSFPEMNRTDVDKVVADVISAN